jgi:transcription antitermination factor NusG
MSVLHSSPYELQLASSGLTPDESSWFALRTRPRFEKKVAAELHEKRIKTFLPLYSATHQWSDRRRVVHLPLFPGYAFVHLAPRLHDRISVLRTNGVISFVGARGVGTPIPHDEIEAVQTVLEQRVLFEPYPYVSVGQRVRIRGGSLDGITGFLTAINNDASLVISVELIQRSVAMRITGYNVEPA